MNTITENKISRFDSKLSEAKSITIVTHSKPDGDAIGSSVAMLHTLSLYGKTGTIVIPNSTPPYLNFITDDICNHLLNHELDADKAESAILSSDLIICLDFNGFHRTDNLATTLSEASADKVLIDHHLNPDTASFSLVFSETETSSASELLFNVLMSLPKVKGKVENLPIQACTALMTGMTTDTNNFANSVFPSTLSMASSLLGAGVDRDMIIQHIYNGFRESRVRLMGHILKDLLKITEDGVAYVILDKNTLLEYNVAEGDTEGFVNIPLSIGKVKMSILIKEDNGVARVSIRSRKGISANRCARMYFNGGGHENAAGGRLYMPENISGIDQAGKYIETFTHRFMTGNDEDNN